MFYAKNLPAWERAMRLVGAIAMVLCAWQFWGSALGYAFVAGAVLTALTALVGFCPMCAVAGRRIAAGNREAS